MRKPLIALVLTAGLAATAAAQQPQSGSGKPAPSGSVASDMAKYQAAVSEERRKLFASGMSYLSASQLQTFWGVYADFEKEQDAIMASRMELVRRYIQNIDALTDAQITSLINESAEAQKKTTDLRVKYFGIYSQKLDVRAAGHFALIDDFVTTAGRLHLLSNLPIPIEGAAAK
ncbi:MAG TPA: hypothetical protein VMQ61_17270 [Thermoanaerobaculia bacterium]|nr:hypothetical protein [Thermoanaerobaculia bacterium]